MFDSSSSFKRSPAPQTQTAPSAGPARRALQAFLEPVDVRIGGDRPWDLQVHDARFFQRVLAGRSMALGESYMDGWWDCAALDQFFERVLRAELDRKAPTWPLLWNYLRARLLNLQSHAHAFEVGEAHYDQGNTLFEHMLDRRMMYSCGYWRDADTLAAAQEAKLELTCRKLGLRPGERVLDIGCGWGGFLQYAAEQYGAKGVGLTVSREQAALARERCAGLPVEVRLQDYRDVQGERFDHVASLGMFEHVGPKNYPAYFDVARRCLRKGGLLLLETIGAKYSSGTTDPWMNKYIFPNGSSPSARQIAAALEGRFVIEDWHNFGAGYGRTLMAWHDNFVAHWDALRGDYDERFFRMWTYYLLACAGTFRARRNQNWQLVLSPRGVAGGYERVR